MRRILHGLGRVLSFRALWPNRRFKGISPNSRSRRLKGSLSIPAAAFSVQTLEPRYAMANASAASALSISIPAAGTYNTDDALAFHVTFSQPVTVAGTPTVDLIVGNAARKAEFVGMSGAKTADFVYKVQPNDLDTNGITAYRSLGLSSGASIVDAAGRPVSTRITNGVPSLAQVKVDAVAPAISSIALPPAAKILGAGSTVTATVTFTEPVFVSGKPTLPVNIGGSIQDAIYVSGNGTKAIQFATRVQAGALDSDGVTIAGPISFTGGATIRDAAGNLADGQMPISAAAVAAGARVDAVGPSLESVSAVSVGAKSASVQARFSEAVVVTGKPFIMVTVGGVAKRFDYASGSKTGLLTFSYTLQKGETAAQFASSAVADSIALPSSPSSKIADALGNAAESLSVEQTQQTRLYARIVADCGVDPAIYALNAAGFDDILASVFGNSGTDAGTFAARAADLKQKMAGGIANLGLKVVVLDRSVMGPDEGAFSGTAAGGPTIYIRSDLLATPPVPELLLNVFCEELGHYADFRLNAGNDTAGDEGEMFSADVRSIPLSDADMARIATENDHGTLLVNGQSVAVEFASVTNASTTAAYTENAAAINLQPSISVARSGTENVQTVVISFASAATTDRISVPGTRAGSLNFGSTPITNGVAVPASTTASGSFWLPSSALAGNQWSYSVTSAGVYTFTLGSNGISQTTGAASATAAQVLLRAIKYDSTSENPGTVGRTLSWQVTASAPPTASFSQTLTLTAVNDAPTITATNPTATLVEAASGNAGTSNSSVTLTLADVDGTASYDAAAMATAGWATNDSGATYTKSGTYGNFTLTTSTGIVGYVLDNARAATENLATGTTVQDSVTVYAKDNGTPLPAQTASRAVTFSIQGRTDGASLSAAAASNGLVEAGYNQAGVSGATVQMTRSGNYDTTWLGTNGWTSTDSGLTYTKNGSYGVVILTVATDVVSYQLDDTKAATNALTQGQQVNDNFPLRATLLGVAADATAVFSIIGTNDAPSITAAAASATIVEQGFGTAGVSSATVQVTKSDVDGTASYDAAGLAALGWTTSGVNYQKVGTYGTATLTTATGVVMYALDNAKAATEALTQGQQVSDSFTVQVTDGAATAQASCTFAIVGTNDAPTISAAAASNNAVEAGDNVAGTAAATVGFTKGDVDGTALFDSAYLTTAGWASTNAGATYSKATTYGSVVLTTATGVLSYTLDNTLAVTQALTTGQQVSEQVTLQVTDGVATATATATITILGSNDAPLLTGTPGVVYDSNPDTDLIVLKNDLIQGYTDPEGDAISIQNVTCVSPGIVHTVTVLPSGDYKITPRPAYVGDATLGYNLVDTKSAVTPVSRTFSFNATNTPPSVSFGTQTPSPVKEAGGINNGVAGVPTATMQVTKSDVETTAVYAPDRLLSNGWQAAAAGTYTFGGTYGTAVLDTATDTLTYTLDDSRTATNALKAGQQVSETFPIFVTDGRKLTRADATFAIVGTNDAVSLTGAPTVFSAGIEDKTYLVTAAQLTAGFSDPDGTVVLVRDVQSSSGTVMDRGNGTWAITPGANFNGDATISYNLVDDGGFATPVQATLSFAAALDAPVVKDFVITTYDQAFLKDQVRVPIVRAVRYEANGTAIYGYADPNTKAIVELGKIGTFDLLQTSWANFLPEVVNWPNLGNTAAGPAEPFGLRNVTGLFNNIAAADQAGWGAAFRPFARLSNADYGNYMTGSVDLFAAYANPFTTIHDGTPRMISQTIASEAAMARADQISGNTLITDHLIYQITDLNTGLPKVGGFDQAGNPDPNGLYFKEDFVRNLNTLPGDPSVTGIFNLFGQFFDHGLDFIGKGGNLTNGRASKVYIDLAPTDPLYDPANGVTSIAISRATVANPQAAGPDGKFRTADDIASPGADGLYGTQDDIISPTNPEYQQHTSPYIDQGQTYGSEDTTTNLLRQWVVDPVTGKYTPGMRLFDGTVLDQAWERRNPDGTVTLTKNTLPTLNELRKHIVSTGRADLSWDDTVTNLRVRDGSGQILDLDPAAPGIQPKLTDHVFIADWLPRLDAAHLFTDPLAGLPNHTDLLAGFAGISRPASGSNPAAKYVSDYLDVLSGRPTVLGMNPASGPIVGEILLRSIGDHYVAGDGRVNENFGLTSMHHVWHENHEWQVDNLIMYIGRSQAADPTKTFAHDWQVAVPGVGGQPRTDAQGNYVDAQGNISWNQEKMFQAAVLVNQREYQHVAIDQYARLVSPNIPLFVMYDTSVNADVSLEYSQAAFRFGHSVLRETIDAIDPNGSLTAAVTHYSLEQAFLTPSGFAKVGPAAIVQGMAQQVGAEIDEFVTPALQQKLLGQPQDLAAINIGRGRDLGIPTLNKLREQLSGGMATQLALLQQQQTDYVLAHGFADPTLAKAIQGTVALNAGLQPYISWADFGQHMAHPESLTNFVAAYAFEGNLDAGSAVVRLSEGVAYADLTAAEQAAVGVLGWTSANATAKALEFMGASDLANKAFDKIDAWIGGLAEAHVFLGELGSTFDAIFSDQMSRLINGDRFYYFWSLQFGLVNFTDLNTAVSTEQFADVIARTTGAKHLVGDVMLLADNKVELGENPNSIASPEARDHKYGDMVQQYQIGVFSGGGASEHANGTIITVGGKQYIYDIRPGVGVNPDGTDAKGYNAHEVISGTDYSDYLLAGDGDDTIWGGDGDDFIDGGAGADHTYGEGGNDYMVGGTVPDFMDGGEGDDILHAGDDTDVLIGGNGNDRLFGEANLDELHGGAGDDYLDGGLEADLIYAGPGNDVVLGGEGLDTDYGQAGDDQMFAGSGPDQNFGGYGDDILHGGPGGQNQTLNVDENLGEWGYNLSSFSELTVPLNKIADLNFQNVNMASSTPFGQLWVDIQGIEGGRFADQIIGDDGSNWLIGGGSNDVFAGGVGDDIIIGDWLRLDTLIGTYSGGVLQHNGVLDTYAAGGGKHFVELLRSYPNFALGDTVTLGALDISYAHPLAGTADLATYRGPRSNFELTPIANPSNKAETIGYRVVDKTGAETSSVGDLLFGIDNILFDYDFTQVNADSAGLHAHDPLSAATVATLVNGSYPLAALGNETVSSYTATLTGYASQTSAAPLASTIGVTVPVNTLGFTIPVAAGASRVLFTRWEVYNPVTTGWDLIAGSANAQTFTPTAANGLAQGSTIRAVAEFVDTNNGLQLIYTTISQPLGLEVVGTNLGDTLTGTAYQDVILGGAANDTLDGAGGIDYLAGMAGDDTYVVDSTADVVVENTNEGVDTVQSSVTYTLGANLENITLTGTGNINAIGNALDNVLTGNSGTNTLAGGLGNDTYVISSVADTIIENAAEGTDTVQASISYTLGANLENLTLTGTSANNGTGNDLANVITGNSGSNTLSGLGGNDTLVGNDGNDVLIGGLGADTLTGNGGGDTFRFALGDSTVAAMDVITDFAFPVTFFGFVITPGDTFDGPNAVSSANVRKVAVAGAYSDAALAAALSTSTLLANGATLVEFGVNNFSNSASTVYLVLNDATAGYDAANDSVVRIVSGNAAWNNFSVA